MPERNHFRPLFSAFRAFRTVTVILLCMLATLGHHHPERAFATEIPDSGLVLWLRADLGVKVSNGRVTGWQDQSGAGHIAEVPPDFTGPTRDPERGELVFGESSALTITSQLLPEDAREVTIFAVAQSQGLGSICLFAIRDSMRPLVQLDVDERGQARFILRDLEGITLAARTPSVLGAKTIFGGVLSRQDEHTGLARVYFGGTQEAGSTAAFVSPVIGQRAWIGALHLPGRQPYYWNGTISEILVYNRSLSEEETQQVIAALTERYDLQEPEAAFADSWDVLRIDRQDQTVAEEMETDVCVIGGGSGGIGAVIAAAREGAEVVLVERQPRLGGTGTNAFVSNWEPGPGCSIAEEMYYRMKAIGGAGVGRGHPVKTDAPMGFFLVVDDEDYESTLVRALPGDRGRRRVNLSIPYKPDAKDVVVREMMAETDRVRILDEVLFFHAEPNSEGTHVESVLVKNAEGGILRIRAKVFIDSTGDVWLARSLGCEVMLGADPRSRFDEPSAPEDGVLQLNAITRCYIIEPRKEPEREPAPRTPVAFPRAAFVTGWKDGMRAVNMMPSLPGRMFIDAGYDECMRRSETIVRAHWHWLQQIPEFQDYELVEIAPMLGIRESYRAVTRYVLTEHDLIAGLPNQEHPDIIAVADHPCDIHGGGGHGAVVNTAYGVPYRCLIPSGPWENLLIACRGSGFSKIAASSVRLQRTMIQIGHAAGMAAAMAAKEARPVDQIDVEALVRRLDARSRYPFEESFVTREKGDHE